MSQRGTSDGHVGPPGRPGPAGRGGASELGVPNLRAPRIRALDVHVINQIAAGEVIDRPAAVVKELLENALDSGARRISIELEQGGIQRVCVTDDGHGIAREDLPLALAAHATSKLESATDLEHIASLGFRGEALASIGAVAKLRLSSRLATADLGAVIENDGGRVSGPRDQGAPLGTQVEVRELFFHTPARRRFLKSVAAELARCVDVVQRLALSHLEVGFELSHDGKRLFALEAKFGLKDRIRRLYGEELAAHLVPVEAQDQRLRLSGFVAPPRFSRGDSARAMWFVNARPVRDKLLLRCLKDAYRGYLFDARTPTAFLHLSLDPALVDVNVHPAKTEVRLRDERSVFAFLVTHLRAAVKSTDMASSGEKLIEQAMRREQRETTLWPRPARTSNGNLFGAVREPVTRETDASLASAPTWPARTEPDVEPSGPDGPGGPGEPGEPDGPGVHAGANEADQHGADCLQVGRTYIVRALADGFEVIDQHALHERISFEALRQDFERGTLEIQRALVPELVELSLDEAKALEEHLEELPKIGVLLSMLGQKTVAVQGLPASLRRARPREVVRGILEVLSERGRAPEGAEVLRACLERMACRASVMAGDSLSPQQMRALIERGRGLESDQTCVHGRPTRVRFKLADLERAFLRKV